VLPWHANFLKIEDARSLPKPVKLIDANRPS
jgi:hypothetical protein